MILRSTFFLFFIASCVGFALFQVKHEVIDVEKELTFALREINREEESLHVLKAEWSYLNEPQRLQALADKYLDVEPIVSDQMVTLTRVMDHAMNPSVIATRSAQAPIRPTVASWNGN
jgi:cell division protein FtsL